jgi:hypothetical protein
MSNWSEENYRMSRDHFKIRRVCDWNLSERPIKTISSGYNHSAILTEGELLTWGGSLYCQLGHGTKADKLVPTQMSGPIGVVWSNVKCGELSVFNKLVFKLQVETLQLLFLIGERCLYGAEMNDLSWEFLQRLTITAQMELQRIQQRHHL